jgi:hypothetical protein
MTRGRARVSRSPIGQMITPVECAHCRTVYDMCRVEVTGRWLDCTAWKAPCCGRSVDDRGETGIGWNRSHYTRLSADEVRAYADGTYLPMDIFGRPRQVRWVD